MMRALIYSALLWILAAFCPALFAQDFSAPIDTTITEIFKSPWSFHNKTVRVTGTFNECVSYTCRICDSPTPVDSYGDEIACMGASFLDKGQEKFVRYSTVQIITLYDADCSGASKPGEDTDEIILCTDRATELRRSVVTEMISERPPNKGIVSSYGKEELIEPSAKERAIIISEIISDLPTWYDLKSEDIDYVYFIHNEDSTNREAAICDCFDDALVCGDIKPTILAHILYEQSRTPYSCIYAEERGGAWQILPK